ncbi:MAG: ABC transporter substrate-binding protein [Acidobacteriaceae bacterium]
MAGPCTHFAARNALPIAVALFLCAIAGRPPAARAQGQQDQQVKQEKQGRTASPPPYDSIAANSVGYDGPGRGPAYDLPGTIIHIGLLAPLHGPHQAEGAAMAAAAQMALHDAGQRPLSGGRRVALALGDESGPAWGHVSEELLRLVADEQAVAVVTSASGDVAHLSEQVGNRIGVPVLTLSSDATTTQIDIPWIFRLGPGDAQQAQAMAQEIYRKRDRSPVLLVTEDDHDGRVGAEAVRKAAEKLGAPAPDMLVLNALQPDFGPVLARLQARPSQALILWTQPETVGGLLTAIGKGDARTPIYLSQKAAQSGSGLVPAPFDTADKVDTAGLWTTASDGEDAAAWKAFARRYQQTTGNVPSPVAARTYDAITLVVRALRTAGPNRARVRDQIARTRDFPGVAGAISFDNEGNDRTGVHLVRMVRMVRKEKGPVRALPVKKEGK